MIDGMEPIGSNTSVRMTMEVSAQINAAEGNEDESARGKPSRLITIGLKNNDSALLSAMAKLEKEPEESTSPTLSPGELGGVHEVVG